VTGIALAEAKSAQKAAARAAVDVRELQSIDDIMRADRLFTLVWGSSEAMPSNLMRALSHSRNYVAGAFRDGDLVAASVAFAWGDTPALHSHISGVTPAIQGHGVGYALKLHQRAWAAQRGIQTITWTFDPLIRRNAWFNLVKLGGRIDGFHPDFYGPMEDGINGGDPTDRCVVTWVVDAESGASTSASDGADRPTAAPFILLTEGPSGEPIVLGEAAGSTVVGCQIPADVVELRAHHPGLAREWRLALRQTMGAAIESGYVATSITREGCYLLKRRPD
jgi:predicted GNAT superfamily acetyltransferase